MTFRRIIALFLMIVSADYSQAADIETAQAISWERGNSIQLKAPNGEVVRLNKLLDNPITVVTFLGTECPMAKLYGPRLQQLSEEFDSEQVKFVAVMSNRQDSLSECSAYAKRHQIKFPVYKDPGNELADLLGASRVTEVFVLDQTGKVQYHGRIDDQYGVGYVKNAPARKDLQIALTELLAGQAVSVKQTPFMGCLLGRVRTPDETSPITYSNQISRLIQKRCLECHRDGEIGPFAMDSYDEVVGWADMMLETVNENRMPPWHASAEYGKFRNDRHMTAEERKLLSDWVAAGCPKGDETQLPKPVEFVTDWQLPRKPDVILPVSDKPFVVKANGEIKYKYFKIDLDWEEERWVKAVEIRPGNRAVVHHSLAFVRQKGSNTRLGGSEGGFLAAYVPGLVAEPYPEGMAKRIPANSEMVFQMHYTPIGTEQSDLTQIGLLFADREEITHEVTTRAAMNFAIEIPPHAENYYADGRSNRAPVDVQLLTMMPHMHVRGKAFRYHLQHADGSRETLLDIPAYDFNWQTAYRVVEPLLLPAGSQIYCEAWYNNSESNLNNPNPDDTVKWGDQTWEEMMIGYFDIAVPLEGNGTLPQLSRPENILDRLDANGDAKISKTEVPPKWRYIFPLLDTNFDGFIDLKELERGERLRKQLKGKKKT